MPRGEGGAAAVDFVLVGALLTLLFALVIDVGVALHARNVLVSSAAEGARYAANADRNSEDGALHACALARRSLGERTTRSVTCAALPDDDADGVRLVVVRLSGRIPLVGLPVGSVGFTTTARSVKEGQ